jgi:hypothetical protein
VEIRSPEIVRGDVFDLDGEYIIADKSGLLNLLLIEAGDHSLCRVIQP